MLLLSNLSLILALQRGNVLFKYIKHPSKCVKLLCKENMNFTFILLQALVTGVICLWLFNLLILSGDNHLNPGPDSVNSFTDTSYATSESLFDDLGNHLSILHVNIQSLYPKMDLIKCEEQSYDILVFSESWLKPEIKDDCITIENFMSPLRTDRVDRPGGGVVIYVKDSFLLKRRSDLDMPYCC